VSSEPASDAASANGPFDPELKEAGQLASPTWELELFLSGALVFATFQLPGLIESVFTRFEPHATGASATALFIGSLYGKAIAFTLIAMFSVHLVARAYWVALLGLQSVFPKGIRWSEMKVGPIAKDVYRSSISDMSSVIARLDNFCSIVFSAGLLLVMVFVFSTLLAGALGGAGYGLAQLFSGGRHVSRYFFALATLFVAVPAIATVWDRRMGERYPPGSRGYRVMHRIISGAYRLNLVRFMGPMIWTLMTNVGRRRAAMLLYIAVLGLIMLSAADRLWQSDRLSTNTYDFFGTSREHGVDYRYYENQREPGKPYPRVPSIQSDIVRDPYVKLFIPYYPRRHNVALARACPGLRPVQERGLQIGAEPYAPDSLTVPALECMARMHAVTVDGAPVPNLAFSFYEQPTTGVKGVIAYIPADSLTRGRHAIGVMPVPPDPLPTDTASLRDPAWKKPFVIPFWR